MRGITPIAVAVVVAIVQVACSDPGPPTAPAPPGASDNVARSDVRGDGDVVNIRMLDNCDPRTFNLNVGDGTCVDHGQHGLPFGEFVAELTANHTAEGWRFTRTELTVKKGTTLRVLNEGGEVHSFTQVEKFGGGVLPFLNQLTGNETVAPECASAPPSEFKPRGGVDNEVETETGTKLYECCIHPWMKTVVHVSSS